MVRVFWACCLIGLGVAIPVVSAAQSPLLEWRDPVYIMAGLAGVAGLGLLIFQPVLVLRGLPGLPPTAARRLHRIVGFVLLLAVLIHVGGLWITSPPDVVDALAFASPTPFSHWGVIAMWSVFASAGLAATWRRLHVRPAAWRRAHLGLALVIVATTLAHTFLVDATMTRALKIVCSGFLGTALCALLFQHRS